MSEANRKWGFEGGAPMGTVAVWKDQVLGATANAQTMLQSVGLMRMRETLWVSRSPT